MKELLDFLLSLFSPKSEPKVEPAPIPEPEKPTAIKGIITLNAFFMGRDKQYAAQLTDELINNAKTLLSKVNALLVDLGVESAYVSSGWRPPSVNDKIGGAKKSAHVECMAVDIRDDGQKLSIRFQTNGKYYRSINTSFTEPWLGGKKPNSLSVSAYNTVQTNGIPRSDLGHSSISISGGSVGLGRRLKWPDDYFSLFHEVDYQYYELRNYSTGFLFTNGFANNLYFQETISRRRKFTIQLECRYSDRSI